MKPANLLFVLSDEHNRDCLGCYGHPCVQTPHLDRLAQRGVRFGNAYTNCPICVPARASLATGRYVHDIGFWDNAFPYDGSVESWGHRSREAGCRVDSIGKLHFRSSDDDNGFTEEHDPLHVVDGVGDLLGSIREDPPFRKKRSGILEAGPGDSTYLRYDVQNADSACAWLEAHANDSVPWILFLSFACPHPPYISPEGLFDGYVEKAPPMPPQWRPEDWPAHPAIDHFRRFFDFAHPFTEKEIRQLMTAYFGVCSYLDTQIGRVMEKLCTIGLEGATRIIYTSDHGENMGSRGLFGKFTMYEESAAVPLILAGPDVPAGKVVRTPVSLVDCYPTILEAVGVPLQEKETSFPGDSLWSIMNRKDHDRTVFSEYHAVGSCSAYYMLRNEQYKFIHYVNEPPQLFDLIADPKEINDLADRKGYVEVRDRFEREFGEILDPEATDRRAKSDQREKVEAFGGESAVRARGAFDNSPAPGEAPKFKDSG